MSAGRTSMSGKLVKTSGDHVRHEGDAYRCEARVTDSGGAWSASAPAYPGVSAAAATEREALDALRDLLAAEIRRRKAASEALPSGEARPAVKGEAVKWVIVRL